VQSWFPFSVEVCLNGREWLARQMDAVGIDYQQGDNCFVWLSDPARAQELSNQQCIRLTNHTADRGSDLPRLFSAGGPRSGRELGDSMHWHIGQSR